MEFVLVPLVKYQGSYEEFIKHHLLVFLLDLVDSVDMS